jgi:restriction endonuclease Mrr
MGAQGDRGVFITTMLRHGVGVQAETTVILHQLDEDFFETL